MSKTESIVQRFIEKPYLIKMGAGNLSNRFRCSREEIFEAKLKYYALQHNKPTDNLQLRSRWQKSDGTWLESYRVKPESSNYTISPEEIKEVISTTLQNLQPIYTVTSEFKTAKALNLWISDEHIGADTRNGLYENNYNREEIINRFSTLLNKVHELAHLIGGFDQINVSFLGDTFDGWDGETTRGGHKLPQSTGNRENFEIFLEVYLNFIDSLVNLRITNRLHFYFVANSNHGGDFDYIGYKTLELYMKRAYPDVRVTIFEKFINHFHYGCHTYIITHGKDQENRKFGFPLTINEQTKNFIADYMKLNPMQSHVHFVKGDLHRSNLDLDRMCSSASSFTYQNVASFFGASKWIMDNFGSTMPLVDYEIVDRDNYQILRGQIYLR